MQTFNICLCFKKKQKKQSKAKQPREGTRLHCSHRNVVVVLNCEAHLYVGKWREVTEKALDLRPKVGEGEGSVHTRHTKLHTQSNPDIYHTWGNPFHFCEYPKGLYGKI